MRSPKRKDFSSYEEYQKEATGYALWKYDRKHKEIEEFAQKIKKQRSKYKFPIITRTKEKGIKHQAVEIFRRMKKAKRIEILPCQVCHKKKVEAHHYDYQKPLKVIFLCQKHHKELHRHLRGLRGFVSKIKLFRKQPFCRKIKW